MLTVSFSMQESTIVKTVGYGANHGGDKMKSKSGKWSFTGSRGTWREIILLFYDSNLRFAQWIISFAMISNPFWSRASV